MNGTFDPLATAGSVYGIVGTGISLGVLAGMSSMVMKSASRMYDQPYERRESYGRPREEYRRRKTLVRRKKPTRQYRDYEEESPRGFYSPSGSMRLNIPRYW